MAGLILPVPPEVRHPGIPALAGDPARAAIGADLLADGPLPGGDQLVPGRHAVTGVQAFSDSRPGQLAALMEVHAPVPVILQHRDPGEFVEGGQGVTVPEFGIRHSVSPWVVGDYRLMPQSL